MTDVFLSYAREDLDHARALVRVLNARGLNVFWDRELIPGQIFAEEIERQLDTAHCVIVLWSQHSIRSPWVKDEASEGRERGCLISAVIDEVSPPLGFRQGQVARLAGWDNEDPDDPELARLIMGVEVLVARAAGAPTPATNPMRPSATARVEPSVAPASGPPQRPLPVKEPPAATPPAAAGPAAAVGPADTAQPQAVQTSRRGLLAPTLLIGVVFAVNLLQTALDPWMTPAFLGVDADYPLIEGFRWFEGNLSFAAHEATSMVAVVGYSVSYFFLFPALAVALAVALARRPDPLAFQTLALAVAITYFVSLPFFIVMPIPERWAFPEANAILLSDLWTASLIEAFRPMSGLDNCFPSFHTSMSVLVTVAAYWFCVRFRLAIAAITATIVLATIALGIHWLPDIIAGALLGALSIPLAYRLIAAGAVTWLGLGLHGEGAVRRGGARAALSAD